MAEAVKVIVRCRPLNQREKTLKCLSIIEMDDKIGQCRLGKPGEKNQPPKAFTFDGVFNIDSITENIYADICFPLVEGAVEGYNGTVFAYGQTGCGKSFTMQGITDPLTQRGIIPRAFEHIFESIQISDNAKFLVNTSYLEIYNEDIRDLLVKDTKNKLEVKEHPDRGVYVGDLSMTTCHNVHDMEKVMDKGGQNRHVGATLMNADSSRSHSIFTIYVETCESGADGEEHIRAGKLNLVDLAGSERQAKTGATGDRLKEATKINLSLSALGNVISALVDGKSKHIPYRDSKLTRLLQDSLGGNTKTLMVACISPADNNYEETLSTLRYANRAKNIKNKPKINEDPKDALLRQYQDEITLLKQLLAGQLQMSPAVVTQLGLIGGMNASISTSPAKRMSTQNVVVSNENVVSVEEESRKIRAEYEEKLTLLQKKYEDEQMDKLKLAEEVNALQRDLSGKLRKASGTDLVTGGPAEDDVSEHQNMSNILTPSDSVFIDKQCFASIDQPLPDIPVSETTRTEDMTTSIDGGTILDSSSMKLNDDDTTANIIQEEVAKKLSMLQQHLVKSEPQIDKAELKKKHNKRKSHYNKRQQKMLKDVQKWEGEGIMAKVYDNLQDEIKDKHARIDVLENDVIAANAEITDLQSEFQSERDDYLESIRKLEQQLLLHHQILDKIQPTIRRDCNYFHLEKIKSVSEYNEESQSWKLPDLHIERTTLPKDNLGPKKVSIIKQETTELDGNNDTEVDRYAIHIHNRSNEDFSNNYFKPKRVDQLLSNSITVSSVLNENSSNLFKIPTSKSPLQEHTRRPLKLEALPPSAFDKKKKKSKYKES